MANIRSHVEGLSQETTETLEESQGILQIPIST